ncbi:peroxiredoxin-2F, mitochondrial [Olea europaea subsp. europaea]|uniref:glutaredoxin-dependent peroxiredoxin n=1 Tax=Olea europaea subsp. europaea TaxID=158383 RepID=A0A8S0SUU7_OLEEU|nr:peroxiredoxin-2F, mitochondrial [Olea europaea subsp. europaea]
MALSVLLKRTGLMKSMVNNFGASRAYASVAVGTDLISAAPDVSLQKARSWDEGVSSKFATTPLKNIFKDKKVVIFGLPGAYTGVCSAQHVPSYKNNIDKFKAKGIDSVICVAVNDPYVMNGWAERLQAKEATGSGKTLAYLLLVFSVINAKRSAVQALILVPTRELGIQVTKVAQMWAANYSELEPGHKSWTAMALLDGGTLRR